MPQIIPIRDLKNTSEISQRCRASNEPIFVTKNGYGDMVIMSMKMYEEKMFMLDVYSKLIAAEEQLAEGKVLNGDASLKSIREKYNV
ncbi:type II toxin-antitoxin system Phd/YefM family antitoxin [Sporomusa aerivorans]|uniref:type II toxin-antitoxin system Phd/YefM family antitoxin n=1 Tax=Sporomusa aerivorans TaxID=204936 RepID=UPI00352A8718